MIKHKKIDDSSGVPGLLDYPSSGLKKHKVTYDGDDEFVELWPPELAAKEAADYLTDEKVMPFFRKNKQVYFYSKKEGINKPIADHERFLRKHVGKKLKRQVSEATGRQFEKLLISDVEQRWCKPLPKRDPRYVVFLGKHWIDLQKKYKTRLGSETVPGFQRWVLHVNFNQPPKTIETVDEGMLAVGQIVSGYVLEAPVFWCDPATGAVLGEILNTAYPDEGAVAHLNAADSMEDFEEIGKDDSVSVCLHGLTKKGWTRRVRNRLSRLVESKKPVVVSADFSPYVPEGENASELLEKSISVIRPIGAPVCNDKGQYICDSLWMLNWVIRHNLTGHKSSVVSEVVSVDPNDRFAMLKKFVAGKMKKTGNENDIIFMDVILKPFQRFVSDAGGEGDRINIGSLGERMRKVVGDNNVDDRPRPSDGKYRSALLGYAWSDEE